MAGSYTCGLLAQGKGHISEGCLWAVPGRFQAAAVHSYTDGTHGVHAERDSSACGQICFHLLFESPTVSCW